MVLEIWSDPEITAQTGYEYTRAIQFQCLGTELLARALLAKQAMLMHPIRDHQVGPLGEILEL